MTIRAIGDAGYVPSGAVLEMTAPDADRRPSRQVIRLLSSDRDGEVVAAARAIMRTLQAEKLDIHVLAGADRKAQRCSVGN